MPLIKLTDQIIRYISLFEGITDTQVKDCLERGGTIYFIIVTGQLDKAIGPLGSNVKRLRKLLNKNINIIEYSPDIEAFIRNIFHEYKIKGVTIKDMDDKAQKVAYVAVDIRDKGKIIGANSRNLMVAREIINRYTPINIFIT